MHRRPLLNLLASHQPYDQIERASLARVTAFVRAEPDCFERSLAIGHVTGAAWIVDLDLAHVLLTHHRKLDMWLQLGGHADGDPDVARVALREAREESGLASLDPLPGYGLGVFDVDDHRIPARRDEPEHVHYDVRFLLQADRRAPLVVSDESHDLGWFGLDEVGRLDVDRSVMRMVAKTREHAAALRGPRGAT